MTLRKSFGDLATWSAILLGFALPISTAASNALLVLIVVLFILAGDYRHKFRAIASNPLTPSLLAFCAVTLLGCAYGLGDSADKQHYLAKYLTLLAVPLLVPLFPTRTSRVYALGAFCSAMLLSLALSYAISFGWLAASMWPGADPTDPVVFKLRITHGFLMAVTAFLLAVAAGHANSLRLRWTLTGISFLAACNVLLMIKGRTGYAVLAILGAYLVFRRFGHKGILYAAFGLALAGTAAYQWSGAFHERMKETIAETAAWHEGKGDLTATGLRLDYYSNTLAIIRDHPWFGVGTGGFAPAYAKKVEHTGMVPSNNPHNQYLLITAQFGLAGLAVLILLYATYWRQAGRLSSPYSQIARGVLLAILVGNLFNSFMLDFTERLFFAWISGVLFAELSALPADASTLKATARPSTPDSTAGTSGQPPS